MTLKTILKNFLNYADTLDAQKKLGKDLYEVDFQKLKALTEELKHDKDYSTSEGLKEVNRRKNRYKDILPYDYTRVILSEYPGVPGSDYINANYIKGASGSLAYIASQGPLPNTVVDFWRMIWECEIQVIVMACNEQESGKYKCECYWPTDEEKKQYGNINVEFVKWRQVCPDFLVRTLKACWETEERVICQFHYTTWPDHGVPNSVQPILELVRLIRDCQASEAVPVLVHCSAGCGRTGTICAIDFVWGLMRMGKLSKSFNLFNVIADMRRQRIAMVQTKEQYVLVHKAVSSLFEQQLRVIDNHTYENLDEDGEPLILKELQEDDIYEDIMEPLLKDICDVDAKHDDKNIQVSKDFNEYIQASSDSCHHKTKKNDHMAIPNNNLNDANNTFFREIKDSSTKMDIIQQENEKIIENTKENDETDLSYSKNSRTLQRLCREESVKRLISGWNKAVEQSDIVKAVSKECHNEIHGSKSPVTKTYSENILYDLKSTPNASIIPSDKLYSHKSDSDNVVSEDKKRKNNAVDEHASSDSSIKASPPEDVHAGKLVGKATVIRRPSIAKLKALFEKSSQPHSESDTNRQRRPLFRSHSHYVSNSSRTFTVSDNSTDQIGNSNGRDSVEHIRSDACTNQNNMDQRKENRDFHNFTNTTNHLDRYLNNSNSDSIQPSDESRQRTISKHTTVYSSNNESISQISSSNRDAHFEYFSNFETQLNSGDSSVFNYKEQSKNHDSSNFNKEKPPQLPTKKKLTATTLVGTNDKKHAENIVPRFQVNVPRENQNYSEPKPISNIDKNKSMTAVDFSLKGSSTVKSPVAHDWNSEDYSKEYRRYSQESEKKILNKNQSFSDPEHCSARPTEIARQVSKQKVNFTEQTYPKLSLSHGKTASDDKLSHSYETTYINVNPLAQKNIRQIEDRLKNHPRGAIIDLTSRKSYIDEMNVNSDKNSKEQFVFRNSSQPVKILQPQESRDLKSHEKSSTTKTENLQTITSTKSSSQETAKNNEHKIDGSKKETDLINSKNLLLHSPPPKSKRGHLSKTNTKSPISPPTDGSNNETAASSNSSLSSQEKPQSKQISSMVTQGTNISSSHVTSTTTTSTSTGPAADRSDPRYFPVMRQTASEAKKLNRDTYSVPYSTNSIYETLYSSKQLINQKSAMHDKHKPENYECIYFTSSKESKYPQEILQNQKDEEPFYGLQRSTSGPQVVPSVSDTRLSKPESENVKPPNVFSHVDEEKNKPLQSNELRQPPSYSQSRSFKPAATISQQNVFPLGPPKPPRTYHYDVKSNQEKVPSSDSYNVKRDGGRYIVTVASPKQSNHYNALPVRNATNQEYRYTSDGRVPEFSHHNLASTQSHPPNYPPPPQLSNEVHMSRSYPLTQYDNVYSHPRPYGKQFYPESISFRNVQPVCHVNSSLYGTVKDKPVQAHQNLYGTVSHHTKFSDYENIYDSQLDYAHNRPMPNTRTEHHDQNPINAIAGVQYSQSDANVYSVVQGPKPINQIIQNSYNPTKVEYQNMEDSTSPSSKRVYFDTLQRRHKQHVTWEQRRSHDDMDIRPAPSARLREQIHARRSMVELDNLEISVASDDGYPEKNCGDPSIPGVPHKSSNIRGNKFNETTQVKTLVTETSKESHHKKNCTHNKEPSFGETLSKAFGKLTSLTKFSGRDAQTNSTSFSDSSNGTKVSKQKEKDKRHDFTLQSPNTKESPSEQWTQV